MSAYRFTSNNGSEGGVSRRTFVKGLAVGGAVAGLGLWRTPALAQGTMTAARTTLSGTEFDLRIGETRMNFTGSPRVAVTVNGSVPAPILRWKEGDTVTLRVAQRARRSDFHSLARNSAAREHGRCSGPELSWDRAPASPTRIVSTCAKAARTGITPLGRSRSRRGLYGPLIIEPRGTRAVHLRPRSRRAALRLDRPRSARSYLLLKKRSDYYNFQQTHARRLRPGRQERRASARHWQIA